MGRKGIGHITSFTGAGDFADVGSSASFVKNSYIVYPQGLNGQNPNLAAVAQATFVKNTMSYMSGNKLTGLDYLFYFLEDLAQKERKKEIEFFRKQRDVLKADKNKFFKETNTLRAINTIIDHLTGYGTKGPADETLSSAFTLLLNPLGYDEIKRQLNSIHNSGGAQHMSDLYDALCRDVFNETYEKYKDEFEKELVVNAKSAKFEDIADPKKVNNLAKNFINKFVQGAQKKLRKELNIQDDYRKELFDKLKDAMRINGIVTFSERSNGTVWNNEKWDALRNEYKHKSKEMEKDSEQKKLAAHLVNSYVSKTTNKRQEAKSIRTILDQIVQNIMGDYLWRVAEDMPAANKDKITNYQVSVHTGDKNIGRQSLLDKASSTKDNIVTHPGTATTDSFSIFSFTPIVLDGEGIAKYYEGILKGDEKALENYLKEFHKELETDEARHEVLKNLFVVHFNTKGYKSQNNLAAVNNRNLDSLMGTFKDISQAFYDISGTSKGRAVYRNEHLGLMFDDLIFMLNNTVKGAAFEDNRKMVESLISYNCCTWMWDGLTTDIKNIDKELNGVRNIHVFQSGGAYFTISDLLMEIVKLFRGYFLGSDLESFVQTTLKPASFNAEEEYKRLTSYYPIDTKKFKKTDNGKMKREKLSYEEKQEQLKKRWMEMRNLGLNGTTLSIHFRQKKIDELLGRLSMLRKLQ